MATFHENNSFNWGIVQSHTNVRFFKVFIINMVLWVWPFQGPSWEPFSPFEGHVRFIQTHFYKKKPGKMTPLKMLYLWWSSWNFMVCPKICYIFSYINEHPRRFLYFFIFHAKPIKIWHIFKHSFEIENVTNKGCFP